MNPPTEQLIRDFLNRLSLAGRGKLGFPERQSLLDRTRARIEAECGGDDQATAVQVRKVLASLGDPIAIVERAQCEGINGQGINGTGGEPVAAVDASEPAGPATSSAVPAAEVPAPRPGLPASTRLVAKGEKNDPVSESDPPAEAALFAAPDEPGNPEPDHGPDPEPVLIQPPAKPASRLVSKASTGGAGVVAGMMPVATKLVRQNPVEIAAVLFLGIGGAVYPPVWLIGVLLAMPSRKWDIRDKFLGVVLPVLLVIFGTVLVLVVGGAHNSIMSYVHEAWIGAERISRLTAFAGAVYLLLALRRSKRKRPKQPPWLRSPRFG
jgi:hypothetical protein